MDIPTATKIAIIATSRNVLAHARIDNSFSIINFLFKKIINKSIHEINWLMTWIDLTLLFTRRPLR